MNSNKHNNKAISVCDCILGFIFYRQKELGIKIILKDKLAVIEEYRECINNGIYVGNALSYRSKILNYE